MNICRITTDFVPPWKGLGPGPYELSIAQLNLGHKVTVITKFILDCDELDNKLPFQIIRIKAKHDIIFSFLAFLKFMSLHIKDKFDIIHNHGPSAIIFLLLKVLIFPRVPIVSSVHIVRKAQYKALSHANISEKISLYSKQCGANDFTIKWHSRKSLFLEKLYFSLSDALLPVSNGLSNEINSEYGITKKVIPILNGVNTSSFVNDAVTLGKALALRDKYSCKQLFIFVGGLNGRKGEFELLAVMQKIVDIYCNAKLLIIGEGPTLPILKKYVDKFNLQNNIIFFNNMPHSELCIFYLASDFFVLPSYSEGLPKVLLEAMITNTIPIVSNIPAHQGIVTHGITGYTFEVGNTHSLFSSMIEAMENHNKVNIANNAKQLIESQYTWQAVANRANDAYTSLISR